jgi:hypothetical protein
MNELERKLIAALVARTLSEEEFRAQFHPELSKKDDWLAETLNGAFENRSAADVQSALIIGNVFGFSPKLLLTLCKLLEADWHHHHEDVVTALDKLRDTRAVPYLHKAALVKFDYRAYEGDYRALASRAIWALSNIDDESARTALRSLADSGEPVVSDDAKERLEEMEVGR